MGIFRFKFLYDIIKDLYQKFVFFKYFMKYNKNVIKLYYVII